MDRWVFPGGIECNGERVLGSIADARLYDGDKKTEYKGRLRTSLGKILTLQSSETGKSTNNHK